MATVAAGLLQSQFDLPARAAAATPKRGGTLTATWGGFEPQALFVPPGGGSSPYFTATKILERLFALDADLKFKPELATELTAAEDFRSYKIKLRENVTWHDGAPFTADDVVFNALQYWKPISAGLALKALTSAEALDAHTVLLKFDAPVPDFFLRSVLAGKGALVIPKHIYEGKEIITNPANNAPIGTGPFKLKEWVRGSHVEYVRNEKYWDPNLPYLDRLVIRWWRDPASRSAAFEAGQLDIGCFNPIPAPDIKRLTSTGRFVADKSGYLGSAWTTTIEFNSRRPVVNRPDVRRALMQAIDRDFIADTIYFGQAKPSIGFIPASNTIFSDKSVPTYPFDPDKAGKLLDAAGFPLKGGSRFKVNLVSAGWFEENIKIGQYLKQAFEDVGLTIDLAIPDRATSLKRIYTDYDYDIAISNNAGSIELVPEWTQFVTTDGIVKGAAFRNASGFSNPKLDQIVHALSTEPDPGKRVELAHEFQQLIATELPITSLVDLEPSTIARTDVRNYSTRADAMDGNWSDVWLDR
jgi:peptide/nickel transport system substrate-binding protein